MSERLIEHDFPIVALNPLSARERNAFKPVYKMHKWFARRSSSIFRAILLGAALPHQQDGQKTELMQEFYRPHTDDPRLRRPDGSPLKVLDPFMGGGTTVVEALRLGFEVVGVDYNPIAWFIVRGETTPVNVPALQQAFERVAAKVKQPLLDLFHTRCPLTGRDDADIIYAFWVKQGICVSPTCRAHTDLFKSYEVARKRGDATLAYLPDVRCPACQQTFDWEVDRCTITAGGPQLLGAKASGTGRPDSTAFAFGLLEEGVHCPHCHKHLSVGLEAHQLPLQKLKTKKVKLFVLLDPSSGDLFEVRGELPAQVTAPVSGHTFNPHQGPASSGSFTCSTCQRQQKNVESVDAFGQPLPFRLYAFYASTPHGRQNTTPEERAEQARALTLGLPTNNMKWFGKASPEDLARVEQASQRLTRERDTLPIPDQEIPEGRNFRDLRRQRYRRWSDLFGPRHQLALGLLLKAISEESAPTLRDALLGAFQSHLDNTSNLAAYDISTNKLQRVTSAHDYRNPTTICENNIWGMGEGRGSYSNCYEKVVEGLQYRLSPDLSHAERHYIPVADALPAQWKRTLLKGSADDLWQLDDRSIDLVVTDPPYAGSVQYAEMSDFFYVWLHKVLQEHYPEFGAEITLKSQEIIEDSADKDADWFFERLTHAWRECRRVLTDEGLLVFTFHHKEGDRWSGLLRSLFDAGFYLVAAYPTHSEALNSIVIQATQGITYDIIHVCRKRLQEPGRIAWTELRRLVRQEARARLRELEGDGQVLPAPDVRIILLSATLRLFSQHYGQVLDADGQSLGLEEALERLSELVQEVRGEELALPGALKKADSLSQFYCLNLLRELQWQRDDLHKELRGFPSSLDELSRRGLIGAVTGRPELRCVLEPLTRYTLHLKDKPLPGFESPLVDKLHTVLGMASDGENVLPLLQKWRGTWNMLSEALRLVSKEKGELRGLCDLLVRTLEGLGPDEAPVKGEQLTFVMPGVPPQATGKGRKK